MGLHYGCGHWIREGQAHLCLCFPSSPVPRWEGGLGWCLGLVAVMGEGHGPLEAPHAFAWHVSCPAFLKRQLAQVWPRMTTPKIDQAVGPTTVKTVRETQLWVHRYKL